MEQFDCSRQYAYQHLIKLKVLVQFPNAVSRQVLDLEGDLAGYWLIDKVTKRRLTDVTYTRAMAW